MERKNFVVKTAETPKEVKQALRLRYNVFHKEFIGKIFPFGVDTDPYDKHADLLVIIDKNFNKVVGTYRLIHSAEPHHYYSSSEFDITHFLNLPGRKLELSRACVDKKYRTGTVMHLLWRGLGEYMQEIEADYLFGCSSIMTKDPDEIRMLYRYLAQKNVLATVYQTNPIGEYRMPEMDNVLKEPFSIDESTIKRAAAMIPPPFRSYMKAGAKVGGPPALDRRFNCIDFLTILKIQNLARAYEKKYV